MGHIGVLGSGAWILPFRSRDRGCVTLIHSRPAPPTSRLVNSERDPDQEGRVGGCGCDLAPLCDFSLLPQLFEKEKSILGNFLPEIGQLAQWLSSLGWIERDLNWIPGIYYQHFDLGQVF